MRQLLAESVLLSLGGGGLGPGDDDRGASRRARIGAGHGAAARRQDDRAARLLVGRIAGLDIEPLELRPQELAVSRDVSPRDDGEAVQAPREKRTPAHPQSGKICVDSGLRAGERALIAHSGETDHPFRPKPITRSGRNRSPIPAETDHPFGAEGTGPES
ncbi:MAG: hypothetical protein OXP28_12205 [Gammaproteobacteria bacterium]|nr:hypothetical protein [Gammaproteobacteria bacterium]